jgi:hypothetical protein
MRHVTDPAPPGAAGGSNGWWRRLLHRRRSTPRPGAPPPASGSRAGRPQRRGPAPQPSPSRPRTRSRPRRRGVGSGRAPWRTPCHRRFCGNQGLHGSPCRIAPPIADPPTIAPSGTAQDPLASRSLSAISLGSTIMFAHFARSRRMSPVSAYVRSASVLRSPSFVNQTGMVAPSMICPSRFEIRHASCGCKGS